MRPTAPIRQTVKRFCSICGENLTPDDEKVCESCWCFARIPRIQKYQEREMYWECITSKDNPMRVAMRLPKTGIPYLDGNKITFWELILNDAILMEWRDQELEQGLDNTELANNTLSLR